jgi:hypothetical protein
MANWIAAKATTLTINSQVQPATDCEYSHEVGEVDVTNLTSGGDYESITDIKKRSIRGTVTVDSLVSPAITLGTLVPASYTTTGGLSHAGNLRITQWSEKGGPRGAYQISFQGTFSGPVTNS